MKIVFVTFLITGFLSACSAGDYTSNHSSGSHGGHSHFSSTVK